MPPTELIAALEYGDLRNQVDRNLRVLRRSGWDEAQLFFENQLLHHDLFIHGHDHHIALVPSSHAFSNRSAFDGPFNAKTAMNFGVLDDLGMNRAAHANSYKAGLDHLAVDVELLFNQRNGMGA